MDNAILITTFISALGCGLIAGAFFAFSTFVMRALAQLPPSQGIAAMQSINIVVINPIFMLALFGTGLACLVLAISSLARWHNPGAGYVLAGSLLYILGTDLVTILFNVPRNNALAVVNPASTEGVAVWTSYLSSWTAWNHVRTIAALAATALFIIALCRNR
jgi:uncharacterized membrane protein